MSAGRVPGQPLGRQGEAAAARELRVTPSFVSKSVARLETQLKARLLNRSARGVSLSDAALRLLPHIEEVVERAARLGQRAPEGERQLTIAAASYLIVAALTVLVGATAPSVLLRRLRPADRLADPVTFAVTSLWSLLAVTLLSAGIGFWLEIPGTRVRAVFLGLMSGNYPVNVALPFSVLASGPWWWSQRTTRS